MTERLLVALPMLRMGFFHPISIPFSRASVLAIRYCGSSRFSVQPRSRQTADLPLPLTQPFSLKSNWPTMRPS
jgi:hypothetical protein